MLRSAIVSLVSVLMGSAVANAAVIETCQVPNINLEGTAQMASAIVEQDSNGALSAVVAVDSSSMSMGTEAVNPNDAMAKIYIDSLRDTFRANPAYAGYDGYGFLGNSMPSSKYMGVLLTARDRSGASLGSYLFIGFGSGKCE